ncbi:MAG: hypothetical protein JSS93_06625 [Bacteroidetes bacterium]|nr:hypothetical protein [Bacteroidota bacterium]
MLGNTSAAMIFVLIVAFISLSVIGVLITRWIGAWMLRINEIIRNQEYIAEVLEEIRNELKKKNQ